MPEVAFRAAPLLLLLAHAAVLASGVQEDQTSDRGNEFVVTAYVPEYSQARPPFHLSTAMIYMEREDRFAISWAVNPRVRW